MCFFRTFLLVILFTTLINILGKLRNLLKNEGSIEPFLIPGSQKIVQRHPSLLDL